MESERAAQSRLLRVTAPRGLALYPTLEAGLVAYAAIERDMLGDIPGLRAQMLILQEGDVVLEVGRRGSFLELLTEKGLGWLEVTLASVACRAVEEE